MMGSLRAQFEHRGIHVEIHEQFHSGHVFWTTGSSPDRFYGACDYFKTTAEAEADAIRELDRLAISEERID